MITIKYFQVSGTAGPRVLCPGTVTGTGTPSLTTTCPSSASRWRRPRPGPCRRASASSAWGRRGQPPYQPPSQYTVSDRNIK